MAGNPAEKALERVGLCRLDSEWALALIPGRAWPSVSGVAGGEEKPRPVPPVTDGVNVRDNLSV